MAAVLAILEIQIEGEHGWAKNLPTWRPKNTWYTNVYKLLMSGRELTGYHITLFTFVFLILHLPFVFGFPFNAISEARTISFFFLFIVLWDFLWFVLNPLYPLKKFKSEFIWWHKKWFLYTPVDYYGGIILSMLVIIPTQDFVWWYLNLFLFTVQTLALIFFTIFILKIDNWNQDK